MAQDISTKKTPLDAFLDYFKEVKPYHTKILEVVQQYNFYDTISIDIKETINLKGTIGDLPLCKPVGFGLDWDEECGFDAGECCKLGTCTSDITDDTKSVSRTFPIISTDINEGTLTIDGNHVYDDQLAISRIVNDHTIAIHGNVVASFTNQQLFTVTPYITLEYTIQSDKVIAVTGDYAQQFGNVGNFRIYGSDYNDTSYHVTQAIYDRSSNKTLITIISRTFNMDGNDNGFISLSVLTINQGVYIKSSSVPPLFNGVDTIVTLDNASKKLLVEQNSASVILKTGLVQNRVINVVDSTNSSSTIAVIVDSVYIPTTDKTVVYIRNLLVDGTELQLMIDMNIVEFTNDNKCLPTDEKNISVNFGEFIEIMEYGGG